MKKFFLSLFILALSCMVLRGQCMPLGSLEKEDLAFKGGENLSYKISFKWGAVNSDVARVTLSLDETSLDGRRVFASRLFGQTAKFYDKFFKLREDFRSWFLVDGLAPLKFHRDTREGRYSCTNDYDFVWNAPQPHILAQVSTSRKAPFQMEIPLDGCTFDVMTLFYTARNMDMARIVPGRQYPMTFAVAEDVFTVYFVYKGKEDKSIRGLGTVKTMRFTVEVVEGEVFTGDSDMTIWFSDDDNRIPVFFEAPLKIGMVKGRLENAQCLAHTFSSLKQ